MTDPAPNPDGTEESWLRVWLREDGNLCVRPSCESEIDAAVTRWIQGQGDTLLHLSIIGNQEVVYLASQVLGWVFSTPESRALDCRQEARDLDEKRANRQAAGLPFGDGD